MEKLIQREKMEAILRATIKQVALIDAALERGEISEIEAAFQHQVAIETLELQTEIIAKVTA